MKTSASPFVDVDEEEDPQVLYDKVCAHHHGGGHPLPVYLQACRSPAFCRNSLRGGGGGGGGGGISCLGEWISPS